MTTVAPPSPTKPTRWVDYTGRTRWQPTLGGDIRQVRSGDEITWLSAAGRLKYPEYWPVLCRTRWGASLRARRSARSAARRSWRLADGTDR